MFSKAESLFKPMMEVSEVTLTLVLPEILPEMYTTVGSFAVAALVNCARVETVVVAPPWPPVVPPLVEAYPTGPEATALLLTLSWGAATAIEVSAARAMEEVNFIFGDEKRECTEDQEWGKREG